MQGGVHGHFGIVETAGGWCGLWGCECVGEGLCGVQVARLGYEACSEGEVGWVSERACLRLRLSLAGFF